MKRVAALFIVVSLAIAGWYWQSRGGNASRTETATVPARVGQQSAGTQPAALGVDEFMRNADPHRRTVSVVGVVSGASADKQVLALIDTKEFAECGTTECASLTLPVRWTGQMPAVRKTVRVEGAVQESAGKLLFVASALQEVPQ